MIEYDYDGLDVEDEPDVPDDDPICSGCMKDFTNPLNEIAYVVPRMSPDGVRRLGVRYYCHSCAPDAKIRRSDGWETHRGFKDE